MKYAKIRWMIAQWNKMYWIIPLLLIFTVINNAAAIAYPLLFKKIMDLLSGILAKPDQIPEPLKQVDRLLWILLAIGSGQFVANFYPLFRGMVNNIFEHKLRMKYFRHVEGKDYAFFQKFRTGDLVARLNDPHSATLLCSYFFRLLDSILILLFASGVMFSINVRLTLLSFAPLPFIFILLYRTVGLLEAGQQKNLEAISNINNQLEMSFSGIRIIKSSVSEAKYTKFFDNVLENRAHSELNLVRLKSIQSLLYRYLNYFAQIGIIIFGAWLAIIGDISLGTFFLFYTYLAIMMEPMTDIPVLYVLIKQAMLSINRLEEIKDFPATCQSQEGGQKLSHFDSLAMKDITFRYPEKDQAVLKNCSFTIMRGEKILILGATGSGKSTLAHLICGILQAESGDIYINDINMAELDISSWRELLGFVPQETLLFSGTVKDNVLFRVDFEDAESYATAVNTSQLQAELQAFPKGDETATGNKGQGVSGGQKQRITIARALYKKPQVLILDDITAALDSENEERLWQALNENYPDITCIAISQRLSTLRFTDSVLFIGADGYCLFGRHEQLLGISPEYANFIQNGM